MVDVGVFKTAHDLDDRVHLADVAEELVAEPFPRARTLHQARDVHELDRRGDDFGGSGNFGQRSQPGVGHFDDADVWINGAEGIILRRRLARPREGVEQSGLANVGQADNPGFEHNSFESGTGSRKSGR